MKNKFDNWIDLNLWLDELPTPKTFFEYVSVFWSDVLDSLSLLGYKIKMLFRKSDKNEM